MRSFLRRAYAQLRFDEAWLCPSPRCHGVDVDLAAPAHGMDGGGGGGGGSGGSSGSGRCYVGSEFAIGPPPGGDGERAASARRIAAHVCEQEGCWHQLGEGHALEQLQLCPPAASEPARCARCGMEPNFTLRAAGQFGWASKEESAMLRGRLRIAQPKLGFGQS